MIAFDLHCSAGHGFEGWFSSSTDYDAQRTGSLLRCPYCDDVNIEKALSAPNIGRKGNQARSLAAAPADISTGKVASAAHIGDSGNTEQPSTNIAAAPKALADVMAKLAKVQEEVLKNSKWVGRKFAEEARAIHYGETDNRQIHGETSPKEAEALVEEGISIAALPLPFVPPEAKN